MLYLAPKGGMNVPGLVGGSEFIGLEVTGPPFTPTTFSPHHLSSEGWGA